MSTNYIRQITPTSGTTQDIYESVDTRIFRATCSTAAGTAAKVATLDDGINFSLTAGVKVAVTFQYGNTAATPTLRVDGTSTGTAKTIVYKTGSSSQGTGEGTTLNTWGAYETVIFTYDGTYWVNGGSSLAIYNASNSTGSHTHGNVQNNGTLQTNDITIATGDKLVVTDSSDSSKIARASISFDTSTGNTEKFLSKAGTWEEAPQTLVNSIYNSTDKEVILTIGSLTDVDNTEY